MGRWFDAATDFWALRDAARRAARGCGGGALGFLAELETEVLALQRELRAGTDTPGPFHAFPIRDPKPRIISAAPFRDRVVHHALCAAMEPVFEAEADPDSFACRPGKGTRAAIWRVQALARAWPWFAKLDIHHCFETADLGVLRMMLAARFDDPPLLAVLDAVLARGASRPGVGLPIGNLTSQHFANFLLSAVDREARRIGVGGWVRYMDDMLLFGPDRETVRAQAAAISAFFGAHLHQREKTSARRMGPCHAGVPALGFRVWSARKRLDGARRRRLLAHLRGLSRALDAGHVPEAAAARRAAAVVGWAAQADTRGLRASALGDT